jgi:lipopolysaccharide heptosyltransferase II
VRLLREQLTDDEIEIVIVGSPAEQELGESIAEAIAHPRENLAGKTTIGELIEHLQTCHIVVSNDTGTMHLAAALGIPTVAIFGSTSPELTSPIGSIHRVIRETVECSPCFKRTCPIDFRCMTRIPAGRVVKEIRALMAHSG